MLNERIVVYEKFRGDMDALKEHIYKTEKQYNVEFPFLKEADSLPYKPQESIYLRHIKNFLMV